MRESQGQLLEALSIYDAALQRNPNSGRLLFARLNVLQQLGQFSRAQIDCATLLALQSTQVTPNIQSIAPFGCGTLALSMGNFPEADRYFSATLRGLPKPNSSLLLARGLARVLSGRADDSLADFNQGLALDPGSAAGHLRRGILLRWLGRKRAAVADFQVAINVGDAEYRGLGILWLATIDRREASQIAQAAIIQMSPDARATWPWSVINVSGHIVSQPDSEAATSREGSQVGNLHRTCTLPFYSALSGHADNQTNDLGLNAYRQTMRALASICPPTSIESLGARLEAAPSP